MLLHQRTERFEIIDVRPAAATPSNAKNGVPSLSHVVAGISGEVDSAMQPKAANQAARQPTREKSGSVASMRRKHSLKRVAAPMQKFATTRSWAQVRFSIASSATRPIRIGRRRSRA